MFDKRTCVVCGKKELLFAFPSDPSRFAEWTEAVGIRPETLNKRDRICQLHFPRHCFKYRNRKTLNDDACPTLEKIQSEDEFKSPKTKDNQGKRCKFCVLCGYTSRTSYSFPEDQFVAKKWRNFCNISVDKWRNYFRVCKIHFEENAFRSVGAIKRPLLKKSSVPSKYPPPKSDFGKDDNNEAVTRNETSHLPETVTDLQDCHVPCELSTNNIEMTDAVLSQSSAADPSQTLEAVSTPAVSESSSGDPSQPLEFVSTTAVSESSSGDPSQPPKSVSTPQCTTSLKRRLYPKYFSEFREEHVQTPNGATRALKLGQQSVCKLRKTVQSLSSENSRLRKRVQTLEDVVQELCLMDQDCQKAADIITAMLLDSP